MWSYYGSKTNVVHLYPAPAFDKIIEPFAGTARYALRYFDRDVLLVDKYEVIIKIWKWLQQCSPGDVLGLPRFKQGQNINEFSYDCDEQRLLIGFLVGYGFPDPRHTASPRLKNRPNAMNYTIKRIASQLWKIKHWKIECLNYTQIRNQKATWFIDPPYQHGGHAYVKSNKDINFLKLADWCQDRRGQIIVCENMKADWLDFKAMGTHHTRTGTNYEAIWSNYPTAYDNVQMKLF